MSEELKRRMIMSLSNTSLYIWKPFSTSPPPPFTSAVETTLNKLIFKTD